jgi:hypothetical protein
MILSNGVDRWYVLDEPLMFCYVIHDSLLMTIQIKLKLWSFFNASNLVDLVVENLFTRSSIITMDAPFAQLQYHKPKVNILEINRTPCSMLLPSTQAHSIPQFNSILQPHQEITPSLPPRVT